MNSTIEFFKSRYGILLAVLLTGGLYYVGNGLNGDFWYLVWVAPVPVLCLSFVNSGKLTFFAAFIAYLLGRFSLIGYLVTVAAIPPAIIYTIAQALIFACILNATRTASMRLNRAYAVFAFPVFFTTYEYLLFCFSPDGTALSIAYSQINCLPLVQIASVTGILGIVFIITLMPSVCAFYLTKHKLGFNFIAAPVAITAAVFLFGALRLSVNFPTHSLKVGVIVMDENKHNNSNKPDPKKDEEATRFYLRKIDSLAATQVSVILLPERALSVDPASAKLQMNSLQLAASRNKIYLITGYTNLRNSTEYNSAMVIDPIGAIKTDYNKVHLVTGLERQFASGTGIGLFKLGNLNAGVAICKDLDFQSYIRRYGQSKLSILFIPAWDFTVDDWLHSRMAILRAVENGFSEVRAARSGCLTISDAYGRIEAEASSSNLQQASLVSYVSTQHIHTFYTDSGDWTGILCILLCLGYFLAFRRLKVSAEIPR